MLRRPLFRAAISLLGLLSIVSCAGETTKPLDTTPPGAVRDLHVVSAATTSVVLGWTSVGDDGTRGRASSYDLRYATFTIADSTWSSAARVTGLPAPKEAGQAETFTVSGLSSGVTYTFALKAADARPNWGALSNVACCSTGDATPPAAVRDLTVTATTDSSADLRWTAVGDDSTTGTASAYQIRYARTPITPANWVGATPVAHPPAPKAAGQIESVTIAGLDPDTTYSFALKVADEVPNWSGLSNVAEGRTGRHVDTSPPATVLDLTVGAVTEASATLTWTAVGAHGAAGTAAAYDLRTAEAPITEETWAGATQVPGLPAPKAAGQRETFQVAGLTQDRTYCFALKVGNDVPAWSAVSNCPHAVTDLTPPPAIADLSVASLTDTSVTLTWTAVGDARTNATTGAYDVRYATFPVTIYTWEIATPAGGPHESRPAGQTESFTVGGLARDTRYHFAAKVADRAGNWSPVSNATSGYTDATPPAAVTDLTVAWSNEDNVVLTWHAPGDDGMNGTASSYDIRYAGAPITEQTWADAMPYYPTPPPQPGGNPDRCTIWYLDPGTIYYFALKAADEVPNWSPLSNVVMAKTPLYRIEAETFTAYQDIGGTPIAQHSCNAASEGMAVDGVDLTGEWIAWGGVLNLTAPLCFVPAVRSAGDNGFVRTYELRFTCVQTVADTLVTLPGAGIG